MTLRVTPVDLPRAVMGAGPWAVTIRDKESRQIVFVIARFDDEEEARRLARGWVSDTRDPRGDVQAENIPDPHDRRWR